MPSVYVVISHIAGGEPKKVAAYETEEAAKLHVSLARERARDLVAQAKALRAEYGWRSDQYGAADNWRSEYDPHWRYYAHGTFIYWHETMDLFRHPDEYLENTDGKEKARVPGVGRGPGPAVA